MTWRKCLTAGWCYAVGSSLEKEKSHLSEVRRGGQTQRPICQPAFLWSPQAQRLSKNGFKCNTVVSNTEEHTVYILQNKYFLSRVQVQEEEEPPACPCMLVTRLPTPFNQSGSVFSIVQIGFRRQNSETVPKSSALLLGTLYKPPAYTMSH